MLEEGHEYAVMLYTWRSCSRAIPQVRQSWPGGFPAPLGGGTTLCPSPIPIAELQASRTFGGPLIPRGAQDTFRALPVKLPPT